MAVHVSPAFRVELGDTVTVGECSSLLTQLVTDRRCCRAMSAIVENCKIQRSAGVEEQGFSQGLWQVLRWIVVPLRYYLPFATA